MTDLLTLAAYFEVGGFFFGLFTSVFVTWLYLFSEPMKVVVASATFNTKVALGLTRRPVPDTKTREPSNAEPLE